MASLWGVPMARKGSSKSGEGQYAPLPYGMLNSDAWRSLSGAAVKVSLELHTRFNGSNNGAVRLSYAEAAQALGIGKEVRLLNMPGLQLAREPLLAGLDRRGRHRPHRGGVEIGDIVGDVEQAALVRDQGHVDGKLQYVVRIKSNEVGGGYGVLGCYRAI